MYCAVYFGDVLVALIEIDGPHHYTMTGELTRKSQFKTWLYERNFPDAPLFRVNTKTKPFIILQAADNLSRDIIDLCAVRNKKF